MIKYYFENIREKLREELSNAEFDIYVAVAWITDRELWKILSEKAKNGLMVQVVLVPDEINLKNGLDFDELTNIGIQIFWDNHHHKYCVIDRSTLITGSYNWTYSANERRLRENIIILTDEPQVCKDYSAEFRMLLKESDRHNVQTPEIIIEREKIVEKVVIQSDEKIIIDENLRRASWFKTHQRRTEWWKSLDDQWKEIFRRLFKFESNPGKQILEEIFNTTILDLSGCDFSNIDGLKHLTNIHILHLPKNIDNYELKVLQAILNNTVINIKKAGNTQ